MKYSKIRFAVLLLICATVLFCLLGCSNGQNAPGEPEAVPSIIQPQVEDKVGMLKNNVTNMNISGAIGDILTANEVNWVQTVLEKNPGLFDAFLDPEHNDLAKTMWHGEFPGKILSGLAQTYLLNNDPKTKEVGDQIVARLKEAQQEDGYLGPWAEAVRFNKDVLSDPENNWGKWDTWGQYHCIYGLCRWYQITGNKDALEVASRALDCIYNYFIAGGNTFASQNWAECNFSISHAFALMYEQTGKQEYLEAAEYIVNEEWKIPYRDFYTKTMLACDWLTGVEKNLAFYEMGQPRWEGLHTLETLAVLYRVTGKEVYGNAMESLWWGIIEHDRHNTGSFGTGEGANGDPYGDGSETCNIVAWTSFSIDYLKMSKNSYVADELELSFYNASLGTLLENDREFTYMNLSSGTREPALIVLEGHSFEGGRDMSCCQANGNRGITQIAEWALLTDSDGLYLNYYGASDIKTATASGNTVSLRQETEYPKYGDVKITVTPTKSEEFSLKLRIPAWAENTAVSVNGEACQGVQAGQYYEIRRTWEPGDVVSLQIDMQLHFWMTETGTAKVSAYYGPLLLAFQNNESLRPTTKFTISELKNAVMKDEGDCLAAFTCKTNTGKDVTLMDYYSAGKDGSSFVTWLSSFRELETISFDKEGTPIWNNK